MLYLKFAFYWINSWLRTRGKRRNSCTKQKFILHILIIYIYLFNYIDFLDVSFNKLNSSYQPYNKPSSPILYVNNKSNHPRQIIKQLPQTINIRLIKLSNKQESFNNVKNEYQKALNSANYKNNLTYDKTILSKRNKKQRKRNIIFFNPTFSLYVNSKMGKQFLNLITPSFDENHPYKKYLTATN